MSCWTSNRSAPGKGNAEAALRLLGRMRRVYGPRFFDAITVDAWYVQGPFLRAVEKLGWVWVVVLKQERMEVYQEAQQLSRGQEAGSGLLRSNTRAASAAVGGQGSAFQRKLRAERSAWSAPQEQWMEQRVRGRKENPPAPTEPMVVGGSVTNCEGYPLRGDLSGGASALGDREQSLQRTDPSLPPGTLLPS